MTTPIIMATKVTYSDKNCSNSIAEIRRVTLATEVNNTLLAIGTKVRTMRIKLNAQCLMEVNCCMCVLLCFASFFISLVLTVFFHLCFLVFLPFSCRKKTFFLHSYDFYFLLSSFFLACILSFSLSIFLSFLFFNLSLFLASLV